MDANRSMCREAGAADRGRRTLLKSTQGLAAAGALGSIAWIMPEPASAAALIRAKRDAMTPDQVGNLTALLDKIKPSVSATGFSSERSGRNDAFVDAVAATNVRHTIDELRRRSEVLAGLEKDGKVTMVGAMYHLNNGKADFFA
ncbi:carbonic anhydrase [Rhodanobacter sp. PCA2]|uniref:carbonic anhydrase n=1 Tax=Rhodanobacter sp. PCA2 TaxID=2006117 RepID=UPI002101E4FB|nr:carbonic anhydrase [Rhodanobacter sp. PCA2]